jgi:hypothetical protein
VKLFVRESRETKEGDKIVRVVNMVPDPIYRQVQDMKKALDELWQPNERQRQQIQDTKNLLNASTNDVMAKINSRQLTVGVYQKAGPLKVMVGKMESVLTKTYIGKNPVVHIGNLDSAVPRRNSSSSSFKSSSSHSGEDDYHHISNNTSWDRLHESDKPRITVQAPSAAGTPAVSPKNLSPRITNKSHRSSDSSMSSVGCHSSASR